METVIDILDNTNDKIVSDYCLQTLLNIIDEDNEEYKLILIEQNLQELVKKKAFSCGETQSLAQSNNFST